MSALELRLAEAQAARDRMSHTLRLETAELMEKATEASTQQQATANVLAAERKKVEDIEAEREAIAAKLRATEAQMALDERRLRQAVAEADVLRLAVDRESQARKQVEDSYRQTSGELHVVRRDFQQLEVNHETMASELQQAKAVVERFLLEKKQRWEQTIQSVQQLERFGCGTESEAVAVVRGKALSASLSLAAERDDDANPGSVTADHKADGADDDDHDDDDDDAIVGAVSRKGKTDSRTASTAKAGSGRRDEVRVRKAELKERSRLRHRAQAALRAFVNHWKRPLPKEASRAVTDLATAVAAVDLITTWTQRVFDVANQSSSQLIGRLVVRRSKERLLSMVGDLGVSCAMGPTEGYLHLSEVIPDRAAHRAGFRAGDVVVQLGPIQLVSAEAFRFAVQQAISGDDIDATFIQGSRTVMSMVAGPAETAFAFRKRQGKLLRQRLEQGQVSSVKVTVGAIGLGAQYVARVRRLASGVVFLADVRRYVRAYELAELEEQERRRVAKLDEERQQQVRPSFAQLAGSVDLTLAPGAPGGGPASDDGHRGSVAFPLSRADGQGGPLFDHEGRSLEEMCIVAGLDAVWGPEDADLPRNHAHSPPEFFDPAPAGSLALSVANAAAAAASTGTSGFSGAGPLSPIPSSRSAAAAAAAAAAAGGRFAATPIGGPRSPEHVPRGSVVHSPAMRTPAPLSRAVAASAAAAAAVAKFSVSVRCVSPSG